MESGIESEVNNTSPGNDQSALDIWYMGELPCGAQSLIYTKENQSTLLFCALEIALFKLECEK